MLEMVRFDALFEGIACCFINCVFITLDCVIMKVAYQKFSDYDSKF